MISYIDEKLFLFKTKFQTRYVKRRRGVCEMHPVPLKIAKKKKTIFKINKEQRTGSNATQIT